MCSLAPPGGYIVGNTILVMYSACSVDLYTPLYGSTSCTHCPANSTTLGLTGQPSCTCKGGYAQFGYGLNVSCSVCPSQTFSYAGDAYCTNCPLLSTSGVGSTTCLCESGYYSSGNGKTLNCWVMPTGQPSRQPSLRPSVYPSSKPTNPTSQPTKQPLIRPSGKPTMQVYLV